MIGNYYYGDSDYKNLTPYVIDISSYQGQDITLSTYSWNVNTNWLRFKYTLS